MPRKQVSFDEPSRPRYADLAKSLADELHANRASGQPLIEEQTFPTGKARVIVIWDRWAPLSMEDRTATILRAYEMAEGPQSKERVVLATGFTLPEAHAAGMLPYQIIPAWRATDPVTAEECRQAMIDDGASTLSGEHKPQLRFSSEDDAEVAKQRLIQRLAGSEEVWLISQDADRVEDWEER